MNITSPITRVNLPTEMLFELASSCRNFARFLSDEVKDITANEESCSFSVDNIAKITLKILEKIPFTTIRYAMENDKNIPLFLTMYCTKISDNETDIVIDMYIDIPLYLKPVLQKPLQRFIEAISEKIKTNAEKLGS